MNGHTPEQIASAYATLDLALAHPDALDMSLWVNVSDGEWSDDASPEITLEDLTAPDNCGTTACYAGWHAARLGKTVDADGDIRTRDGWIPVAYFVRIDLGLTPAAASEIFRHTGTSDLPAAIEDEFGPRPDPA